MPTLFERPLSIKSPFVNTLEAASIDRSAIVRRVAGDVLIRESGTIGLSHSNWLVYLRRILTRQLLKGEISL